jgi:hypothetical protein
MVSLVIPNVGFASLLTQATHLILGCAWTAATLLMALQGLVCPVEVVSLKHTFDTMNSQTILMSQCF